MEQEQSNRQQPKANIIRQFWGKYFPYWPVFLILCAVAALAAWYFVQFRLPVYEASATLLIKDQKKGIEDSKMAESFNFLASTKIIENETEVLKSRKLLSQVVNEHTLYAPVFEKANWKDKPVYQTSPILIEARTPDSLIEAKQVDFRFSNDNMHLICNNRQYKLNEWVSTPWGELRFTVRNANNKSALGYYFSLVHPKKAVQSLYKNLDISPAAKLSSVVYLTYKDAIPKRAEDVLNTLLSVYEKAAFNEKNALAANTLYFLDERLQFVSKDLDSIEQSMQQYRAQKGAIDISSQGKLFLENVSNNDQKLSEVNMKLALLGQIEESIFSADRKKTIVPTSLGFDEPVLTNLLNKLYDLELQYEKLRITTGENNPEATALVDQIQKVKPNILENIRSQKRSLEINKANLFLTNDGYNSLLKALPQQERDLIEISREQNIKSSIYNFLLQRREETALSLSATVSDSQVIDKAESSFKSISIGNSIIYALSVVIAFGLGIGGIAAREFLTNKILYREEIEGNTKFPVIGEVSTVKSKSNLVLENRKNFMVVEQFRHLRTSLNFLGLNGTKKKLLITSTIPGEGKSFIAINLAHSLATAGKKVALVDFDLSNPTLDSKLNITAKKGLSNFLRGEAEVGEILFYPENRSNFCLVAAGSVPRNPSELIINERAERLLNHLQASFDYVIVDSAPVGVLSDGYVLTNFCDATLYVVRHNYTSKTMLERLENQNRINELKNIALVFNGVRSRGFASNLYGYEYGYGYGGTYLNKKYKQKNLA